MSSRTSTRGGAAPYRKGAAHERGVATFLRERGALVVRSPQSGQEMDLTVLWPVQHQFFLEGDTMPVIVTTGAWLVQCKTAGYMRPAEREALKDLAKRYGCRPVMAGGKKPYTFTDLTTGGQIETPSTPDPIRPAQALPGELRQA